MTGPYLLLWLEGPLQAWGHDSRFGRRESLGFPTKSGVLGLICCALGAGGKQLQLLAEFADLDMQLVSYGRLDRAGEVAPRQTPLRDFQMVGSGYDDADPWENLLIPKTNEGKKAVGGGTKMTYRYYLQDACFGVALQVPEVRAAELEIALKAPVWDLYLGRKCCAPTEFIFQGQFGTADEAFVAADRKAAEKTRTFAFRVVEGAASGAVLTLNDVPLEFGVTKRYRDRQVTIQDWRD